MDMKSVTLFALFVLVAYAQSRSATLFYGATFYEKLQHHPQKVILTFKEASTQKTMEMLVNILCTKQNFMRGVLESKDCIYDDVYDIMLDVGIAIENEKRQFSLEEKVSLLETKQHSLEKRIILQLSIIITLVLLIVAIGGLIVIIAK